jgi:hypothetical protein
MQTLQPAAALMSCAHVMAGASAVALSAVQAKVEEFFTRTLL